MEKYVFEEGTDNQRFLNPQEDIVNSEKSEVEEALEIILGISDAEYLSNNQATLTLVELATKFREQFEEMCNATRH